MLPPAFALRLTSHASALERRNAFSMRARASWGVKAAMLELPRRVDHVHAVEPGRRRPVGHRADLSGLALAVEERAAQAVVGAVADLGAGIPERLRVRLVGDVAQRADEL